MVRVVRTTTHVSRFPIICLNKSDAVSQVSLHCPCGIPSQSDDASRILCRLSYRGPFPVSLYLSVRLYLSLFFLSFSLFLSLTFCICICICLRLSLSLCVCVTVVLSGSNSIDSETGRKTCPFYPSSYSSSSLSTTTSSSSSSPPPLFCLCAY